MDKVAFKQKFRIIAPNGTIVRLNHDGIWKEGFDTFEEAQLTRNVYYANATNLEDYKIEPYSPDKDKLTVPVLKDKQMNKELAKRKVFSGKGLKFNSSISQKDENKYKPDKFYSREVWLAQSAERSKGQSVIAKVKPKKLSSAHERDNVIKDMEHGYFIESTMLESLRKKEFPNRKALWEYLKPKGFSQRQMKRYAHQLWAE